LTNCSECPSYNRGQGTRKCLRCSEYALFRVKEKPAPNICRFPQEFIDNVPDDPRMKTAFDLLASLDDISATMLLQSTVLKMTHQEIADYHQTMFTRSGVTRRLKVVVTELREKKRPSMD